MRIFTNANYNFIQWRWHAVALSTLVLAAGIATMVLRGVPLGIDFTGGTILVLQFQQPVTEDQVRTALAPLPGDKVVQRYGDGDANELLIRLPQVDPEHEDALEEGGRQALALVEQANLGPYEMLSLESVGPVIGRDLQRKGIWATVFSLLGIAIYIALRFRPSFAAGAIVAAAHDILITLTFLTFFGYELSLNVVAAILAITGYSVNDTIVIFDRVRENLRLMRRESLERVVNLSVNQTLGRTVITSGTTVGAVLCLFLLGGEVLRSFSFAMLVGVLAGTYSTVFIAAAIAIIVSQRKGPPSRTAAPQAEKPAEKPAETAGAPPRKPGRNVRVS
jgi:preprotein translocase subunit SecF